jgi:acetylornithine deacetylase
MTAGRDSGRRAGNDDELGDAAVDLAAQLVAVDTVNPALVPGAAGEEAAVELLAGRLAASGFAVEVVRPPQAPHRPSVLATRTGSGGGRSLLLNGHLDTVGVAGMAAPFDARIDGDRRTGRLLGRGACDMKAGIAAMVVAAEAAAAAGTAGDVVLALVADEEHASVGTDAVIARLSAAGRLPDGCIVGEPTWLDLAVAHRGFAVIEVELRGRAAHSSRPGDGVNALTHLGRLLGAVERRSVKLAEGPAHPVAGHGSLMATVAGGGEAPFTLPASAHAVIERRTVPGEVAADAVGEIEEMLAVLRAADPCVDGTASLLLSREAWQVGVEEPAAHVLLGMISDALVGAGRPAPARVGMPYWMESALWGEAGVPTVVCGPAGGGLHAADEWVDPAQVRAYAFALREVVDRFCAG